MQEICHWMLNYLVILELLDLGIENFMVEKREKEEEVDRERGSG